MAMAGAWMAAIGSVLGYGREQDGSAYEPPEGILLKENFITVGRSYGSDVKLLNKFISRKHATLVRIDGKYYLEAVEDSVVLINGTRVRSKMLEDGMKIMFGGVPKTFLEGSSVAESDCSSYLLYKYNTPQNIVASMCSLRMYTPPSYVESDLIKLTDVVNGRCVTNVYSGDDFEGTRDELARDTSRPATIVTSTSTSSASPASSVVTSFEGVLSTQASANLPSISNTNTTTSVPALSDTSGVPATSNASAVSYLSADTNNSSNLQDTYDTDIVAGAGGVSMWYDDESSRSVLTDIDMNSRKETRGKRKRMRTSATIVRDCDSEESRSLPSEDSLSGDALPYFMKKAKTVSLKKSTSGTSVAVQKVISETDFVQVFSGQCSGLQINFRDKSLFKIKKTNNTDVVLPVGLKSSEQRIVLVNVPLVEKKLKSGELLDPDDALRFADIVRQTYNTISMEMFGATTNAENEEAVQPKDLTRVKLKSYQLQNIQWMMNLESTITEPTQVSALVPLKGIESSLRFDINRGLVYQTPVPIHPYTTYTVSAKGGILADEMGLGKTMSMIGLILSRPGLIHNARTMKRLLKTASFIPCKANLVIAPSHLTAQWRNEIINSAPSLKTIMITTKRELEQVTYNDILSTDVVIISVQLVLLNHFYTKMPAGAAALAQLTTLIQGHGMKLFDQKAPNLNHFLWWRLIWDEAHESISYQNHCPDTPKDGLKVAAGLKSSYRWYVTGTPFPHAAWSIHNALQFLEFRVDEPRVLLSSGSLNCTSLQDDLIGHKKSRAVDIENIPVYANDLKHYNPYPLIQFVKDKMFMKNTKESVGSQYYVPQYVEELMLLKMTAVERAIYDRLTCDSDRTKLCCHLQLVKDVQDALGSGNQGSQKSLEEIKRAMIAETNRKIEKCKDLIKRSQDELVRVKEIIDECDDFDERRALQREVKLLEAEIRLHETALTSHNSSLQYFQSIPPNFCQSTEESTCIICFEEMKKVSITPCGHMFCTECIRSCVNNQSLCPTCRRPCTEAQLTQVMFDEVKKSSSEGKCTELKQLTETYGTKMAYLLYYLRYLFKESKESRAIVFSQHDAMLERVGQTLREMGISNSFIKGNVFSRRKAVSSFKAADSSTRVIMLSLENAASGTDLIEATHIILLDPVSGSRSKAVAVEAQAIGRAHRMGQTKQITVVRMIMKDTVEHELYIRNQPEQVSEVELDIQSSSSTENGVQIVRTVRAYTPALVDTVTDVQHDSDPEETDL